MSKSIYQILIELEGDQQAAQAMSELGTQVGLTGAALTAFSGLAAKLAMDYETALANVSTVSSEATGSTEEFSAALFGLQADLNGALNVQEAAVASYDLLSSGIQQQEAILQALSSSQKAAIAGQSDLNTISAAATALVNSYGSALGENLTQAEKFDKVVNLMLQTQMDGVITADEYASSVGRVAASFKVAGLSIEEVNAIIALTTVKGIPAAASFTNLNQAISNIQKPSAMAAEEAKRMGVEFNAARLQTVGLQGIIQDMVNSGEMLPDTLAKMFESTEARNSISVLVDNIDELDGFIEKQINGLDTLDKAYALTSNTRNQQITESINLAQGALIQLGQGVILAAGPFIDTLAKLAQQFAELDPKILQLAGSGAILTGGVLTVTGALALLVVGAASTLTSLQTLQVFMATKLIPTLAGSKLATLAYAAATTQLNLGQVISLLGTKAAALKSVTLATTTATLATGKFATGLKALLVTAGPLLVMLASIPFLLDKLNENNANRALEELNNQLRNGQIETQALADKASSLGLRIQETGEAIPQAEFDQWIALLEQANAGNGSLTGTIEALKRAQSQASETTKTQVAANQENTKSAEDTAKAYSEYAQSVSQSVALIEQQKANQIASLEGSEADKIRQRIELEEQATQQQISLLEDLARQSGTSAEDRLRIETDIQTKLVALNQARVDANNQLEEIHTQYLRDAYSQRKAEIEAYKLQVGGLNQQAYDAERKLLEDIYATEVGLLTAKRDAAAANSAERQTYVTQLAELELKYLQDTKALAEAKLQVELDGIQALIGSQTEYLSLIQAAQDIQTQYVDNLSANLGTQESILSGIGTALDDQNMSLSARLELLDLASQITGQSVNIDNAQAVIQEQIRSIEQRKLELKIRQLEIEREQLKTQSQIKQLELQGQRQEIQAQLNSGTLNDQEANRLRQQDSNLGQRQSLEQQMAQLLDQSLTDAIANTQLEGRLAEILSAAQADTRVDGGPVSLSYQRERVVGQARETGQVDSAGLKSWLDSGQISKQEYSDIIREANEAANQTNERLAKEKQAADEKLARESQGEQRQTNQALGQLNANQGGQLRSLNQLEQTERSGLEASTNLLKATQGIANSMPVVVDRLTAISQTNSLISRQVDFIQKQLAGLPGAIANLIPRPAPPSRK